MDNIELLKLTNGVQEDVLAHILEEREISLTLNGAPLLDQILRAEAEAARDVATAASLPPNLKLHRKIEKLVYDADAEMVHVAVRLLRREHGLGSSIVVVQTEKTLGKSPRLPPA